ncbi:MAG TPA: N-acetylglucosamine-6-phosphate deacetylase [Gaiellaceae bacterium]|nr:N-acetylglucosamine-6-phosphate deacetylase [Gaiellaceae bacterium]
MKLGVEAAVVEGALVPGDVEVVDGRIAATGIGATGIGGGRGRGIAVPGFVDLHVHGFGGVDFATTDAAGYAMAGEALAAAGVTAFQPSFITAPEDQLVDALRAVPDSAVGPRVLGAHLEGPFISAERLGMHPASARRDPDVALLERLLAAGRVAHVTLAPELPGAQELVDLLVARHVTVACGHTNATAAEARGAFDRGATHVTHLFNAMRPFGHRDPGIAAAALVRDDVTVELILDGNHVADEAAELAWRAAAGRVVLVTDSIGATSDGRWRVGPVEVDVRGGEVRGAGGELAGSVLTMPDAIRCLIRLGAPFERAVEAASRVPAHAARRPDLGRLVPGATADVVVLDGDVEVRRTLVGGATVFG